MKINNLQNKNTRRAPAPGPFKQPEKPPRRSATTEEHQEFIREMNEFVAKAGLLSDDPFFGGI